MVRIGAHGCMWAHPCVLLLASCPIISWFARIRKMGSCGIMTVCTSRIQEDEQ